uniref:Caerulein precursor fragment-related peptide BM5 n=1 Tax=Xenopus boumbaensis TaxID=288550 RepID=CRBM5_XENBM|nr:RecName: Full=Caerulein precursor fragment-related peptide BM5; AltName: Full=CPF-RP-BM5 [Xenopus boumbaensis]
GLGSLVGNALRIGAKLL